MDCHTVQDLSIAYLEGELSFRETATVRLHLARCSACRQRVRLLGSQDAILSTLSPPPDLRLRQPGFWDRMDRALATEAARSPMKVNPTESTWREPLRVSPVGALAYAAALVLAVAWGWLQHQQAADATAEADTLHAELEQERRLAAQPPEPVHVEPYRPVSHTPRRGTF